MTAVISGIVLYILIAAIATFALFVFAAKTDVYDPELDFPWPIVCGIFWPIAGPIAAAFIAANWFLNSEK